MLEGKSRANKLSLKYLNNLYIKKANFKKSILERYKVYDSIYVNFLKWQNFRNGGQINDYQMVKSDKRREKDGEVIKDKRKDLRGVRNTEYLL